ncbi:hypothetical protein PoB_002057100 [Plakobranchus ocellatus]|uniref:Uncharacterized protein n=1 Tax=Plakobranchus ocellatus TaxID=259542 RepID=A0AAV3ZDT5_9GAST|nr:hypothetical protein PoB_002057100 [Plakobranchus ocellatus]
MSIAHSVTVIAWKTQTERDTKRSQWQHSVPRALRTETNFQTNVVDLSFEQDAGDLHVSLPFPEQKDLLVISPSSFELIVVKQRVSPKMDNQERDLCRHTGVTLETVDCVMQIALLGGSYQEMLEDFGIHSSFAVDTLPTISLDTIDFNFKCKSVSSLKL